MDIDVCYEVDMLYGYWISVTIMSVDMLYGYWISVTIMSVDMLYGYWIIYYSNILTPVADVINGYRTQRELIYRSKLQYKSVSVPCFSFSVSRE